MPIKMDTRFNKMLVKSQFEALLKEVKDAEMFTTLTESWFNNHGGEPDTRPRYRDDIKASLFIDDKPKRILLSAYKEYKGGEHFRIGMNYGVYIGKTLVGMLGGSHVVERIIALDGLNGVWNETERLDIKYKEVMASEIEALAETINLHKRMV